MSLVVLAACFTDAGIAVGQDERAQPSPQFSAKQAMDYFAGDWRGTGTTGSFEYSGRERAEWDLHHSIMSHRTEFFGRGFAQTLMVIRRWDPQEQVIAEHQFGSWGIFREGQYNVVRHGDWFQLVGLCRQTSANGKRTSVNVITVHDANHYTWAAVPQLGLSGNPMCEDYAREGVEPRSDTANRTDDYLREAIQIQEEAGSVDAQAIGDLKTALARFLIHEKRHSEAVEVLEDAQALQNTLPTPDASAVELVSDTILRTCRDGAYETCMDKHASAEDLHVALQLAQKAASLAPDDRRTWLQAFAHYRLGEHAAAQKSMHQSMSSDVMWPGSLLLAAMIEKKSGNGELANALFVLGVELASKFPGGEVEKWKAMASAALGDPPALDKMDSAQRLTVYETVMKGHPQLAETYRLRGRFYGSLGEWAKARADYSHAAELLPTVWRYREAEAGVTLHVGTPQEQDAVCRKFFEEWAESDQQIARMDMVLMCSLCASANIDRQRLTEIADEVLARIEPRAFLTVAKGMSLYRLGRYPEVLDEISLEGTVHFKVRLLGQIFLAMAHMQMGAEAKARELLQRTRADVARQIATPRGAPLVIQDRPVVWCMIHTALQEAEQLINGDEVTEAK